MIRNRPSANLDKYLAYLDADGNTAYALPNNGKVGNYINAGTIPKPNATKTNDYAPTTTSGSSSGDSVIPPEDKVDDTSGDSSTGNTASNQFSATYQGTDFLEWYKANYGTDYDPSYGFARKNGMSDVDWDIGNSLYDSYRIGEQRKSEYDSSVSGVKGYYDTQMGIAKTNRDYSTDEATKRAESSLSQYEQYYNLSKDALDKSRRQSQQNASITLDKLKKYLPTQIKAQGLGGLGVSESTMLQAYNDYASDMGTIESEYQKNKTDLETNYQDNRRSAESERDSAISAANNTYDTSMATLGESKARALSDLERAYSSDNLSAWQTAKDSVSSIFDKYKEKFEDGLKQAYQNESLNLETMYQSMLSTNDGKISQEDYNTLAAYVEKVGNELGEDYRKLLESTLNGYALSIRSADEQTQADKEALIDKWRNGVSDGFSVHSTYGGGFSVGNGMKVKIKDGDQGMSLATFAEKAEKSGSDGLNSGEAGWFGSEKKDSKSIAKLAKEGKLANGTIVDTNAGSGTKYWVYLNGYFYRVELAQ